MTVFFVTSQGHAKPCEWEKFPLLSNVMTLNAAPLKAPKALSAEKYGRAGGASEQKGPGEKKRKTAEKTGGGKGSWENEAHEGVPGPSPQGLRVAWAVTRLCHPGPWWT